MTSARCEGLAGVLYLLAILNVFVGVFNMFPLLPLDGGHAAIATYERIREIGRGGRRYFTDVARLMPFTMGVIVILLFLFMSGLYLDITSPMTLARRCELDLRDRAVADEVSDKTERRLTRQIHVGSVAGRRRSADLGAVDDDHQDGRRRGHAAADLRVSPPPVATSCGARATRRRRPRGWRTSCPARRCR